ncbi:MAG: site-2 protease family protein, partial [Patescibacteria group bacterium]
MFTAIAFIIILGILVFVHELGHFFVAKKFGIRVEEFGFGFPPRLFGFKRGETIYSFNLIPLGGFVKIFGEDGEGKKDHRAFGAKKIWQRTSVLLAGVAMNILLAVFLLTIGFMVGLPWATSDNLAAPGAKVQIVEVVADSPAAFAGLRTGDFIKSVQASKESLPQITVVSGLQDFISRHQGEEIILAVARGTDFFQTKLIPRINPPVNEGSMGVGVALISEVSYPWYRAIGEAVIAVGNLIWLIFSSLSLLIWQFFSHGRT